jgi:hypothetical protein
MDLTPEERRRIYEEEKARVEAQAEIKSERRHETGNTIAFGCLIVIGFFLVIFFGSMISDKFDNKPTKPEPLTEEQKLQRGCAYLKATLSNKPISDLSIDDLQKIDYCKAKGYW